MISNNMVAIYPKILNFTYEVVNSLKGKKEKDHRKLMCEHLAFKIFLHAATIQHLRIGSNITLDAYPDGAHVIDFASIFVLTRAIFETYLNLFEVFFEVDNDDEFEYRYAVYQVRGLKIANLAIENNPAAEGHDLDFISKVQQRFDEIENFRERIKNTIYYQKLDHNQQKLSLKGVLFPKRNKEEIAKMAGFGKKTFQQTYTYLSAYTHGDSLSIAQIKDAVTDEQKGSYIRLSLSLVMMVLSHLILNYAKKFPEAKAICDGQPANTHLVRILAEQAVSMK